MEYAPQPPQQEQGDRFGLTMFASLLVHMLVILGVTFTLPKLRDLKGQPTLEITLVQTTSDRAPDQADFLAQANQDGGGNSEQEAMAGNPMPIHELGDHNRDFMSLPAVKPPQVQQQKETTEVMSGKDARKLRQSQPTPEQAEEQPAPTPPGLFEQSDPEEERARLSAEISRFWQDYQKQPKRKYVNARTREYKYATYMEAWRAKVVRIGNLNYPEKARRSRLSGSLILDVALNANGTIEDISIVRSSGKKLLDDAAVRIVELAMPYDPFPPEIRRETDILHITRTWQFADGDLNTVN